MYIPRPFVVGPDTARELLREVTVAQLVTATAQGPMATLLPWLVDLENETLVAHMARANAQWQTPWTGQALVIASGPDGYVSPSWYASKIEHGRVVPTWDYVVLHVHGDLRIHDDADWVARAVSRLTDLHEKDRVDPWRMGDAPADYISGQLQGIVGLELRIDRVEAAVKMSQGKSAADVDAVIAGLTADGNVAASDLVRQFNQ